MVVKKPDKHFKSAAEIHLPSPNRFNLEADAVYVSHEIFSQ